MPHEDQISGVVGLTSDWVHGHREYLEYLGREYQGAASVSHRRRAIGVLAVHMLTALEEIGVIAPTSDGPREMIEHLTHMFSDLDKGVTHPLAAPLQVGGTAIEIVAEREIRLWAVTAVSLLRKEGVAAGEANKIVVGALSKAGYQGRQHAHTRNCGGTGGFPTGTLGRWFNALRHSTADQERVEAAMATFRSAHAMDARHGRELALAFVADESGLLRSLIAAPFRSGTFG